MSTELTEVTRAVAEFDRVALGLAELRKQYASVVYDVTTTKGMTDARAARAAIREPRYEIERIRKSAKAPILALGKKLDSEAARITGELEKLEAPIDGAIKAEEDRKEQERLARIAAEEKRVADLQQRVAYLRGNQTLSASSGSALIAEHISDLEGEAVDESLQEFQQQGADAKTAGLARLRDLLAAAQAHEAEQARIKAEREELAKLRQAEQERQAAERARIAEEERAARVARDAETARQNAELRRQREEQEAEATRVREANAAEERRLSEERAALAREQEALRKAQEPPPAPPPAPPAPVSRRGVAVPVPKAEEIIDVLSKHYRARPDTIIEWLRAIDWKQAEAA
jgi:colicin import membrane protein